VVELDINLAGDRRLDLFLLAARFDWVNVTVLHHLGGLAGHGQRRRQGASLFIALSSDLHVDYVVSALPGLRLHPLFPPMCRRETRITLPTTQIKMGRNRQIVEFATAGAIKDNPR
jgi:hypothetical protein